MSIDTCRVSVRGYWSLYPDHSPAFRVNPAPGSRCPTSSHRPNWDQEGTVRQMTRLQGAYYTAIRQHLRTCPECLSQAGEIAAIMEAKWKTSPRVTWSRFGKTTVNQFWWLFKKSKDPRILAILEENASQD